MGNTSSAPSAREQHRLSKPKTNTNGSFSSPKLDTCDSPTSPTKGSDVTEEEVVVRTSSGEYRSRQDARQHIRSQLFGSSDSITTLHSGESNDSLRDLASHVKDRLQSLSRSGSIVSQLPSAQTSSTKLNGAYGDSRLSLVPETQSIDIETAITILQELRKTASPEDLVALRKIYPRCLGIKDCDIYMLLLQTRRCCRPGGQNHRQLRSLLYQRDLRRTASAL